MTEPSSAKKPRYDQNEQSCTSINDDGEKLNDILSEADRAIQESNKRHIKPVVDESKLGIELFVGDVKNQYHGLVKARYADFIVHEIDLDGNMAQLTNLDAPADDNELSSSSMKLEDLFDRKVLVHLSNVNNGTLDTYKIDVTGMDKDMRTSIHHAIRASYDKLESSTVCESERSNRLKRNIKNVSQKEDLQDSKTPDSTSERADGEAESSKDESRNPDETSNNPIAKGQDDDQKFILVTRRNKVNRPRSVWPQDRPDYTHFVLYKENKDTMDAIHNIALVTHTKPSHFGYAGTKDRRAVTTQWVSSWRLDPKRLIGSMRRFNKRPFLKVGNFCYRKDPIRLGQLRANRFDIVIRNLAHNSRGLKVIEEAMNYVKDNGFVNYFGLQRFGTRSVATYEVGIAVLQGNWKKAVDLILSYRYDDNLHPVTNSEEIDKSNGQLNKNTQPDQTSQEQKNQKPNHKRWASGAEQHNACIDLWKSKQDAESVFKKYPHFRMTNEGSIIRSLSRSEESIHDYSTAILSLPRNTRSMYVHSYQSLIWNKLTTLRLKKFGYKVIPGDLLLRPEANIPDNSLDIVMAVDEADVPDDAIISESADRTNEIGKTSEPKLPIEEIDPNIIIATEDNLDDYCIFDVVLPLVGSKTRLPENEIGQELVRLLAENGLTLESFKAREKPFVSYGSYRKVMVKPKNLDWSIKQYSNPHENLIPTDLDKLPPANEKAHLEKGPSSPIKSDSSDEALIVGFELPPSSYATMCLRELMKKPSTDFNNRF